MNELPAPEAASNPDAVELLRAWIIDGGLDCVLQADALDPPVWGEVLAAVAQHIARARQEQDGTDPAATLQTIREAFLQELGSDQGGNG